MRAAPEPVFGHAFGTMATIPGPWGNGERAAFVLLGLGDDLSRLIRVTSVDRNSATTHKSKSLQAHEMIQVADNACTRARCRKVVPTPVIIA